MKISIAMATYNGEKYIKSQLESILNQTLTPFELVIFDDGSKDNTVAIVRAFAEDAEFSVKIFLNEKNFGSTLTFNKAISCCSGDVIVLCDQDDLWIESRLEKIKCAFEENSERAGVYSNASLIDKDGVGLGKDLWSSLAIKPEEISALGLGGMPAFKVLLKRNVITGAAFAFRKASLQVVSSPASWVHDAWIAINLVRNGSIYFIPECLVKYRLHESNQIGLRERSPLERFKLITYFSDLIEMYLVLKIYLEKEGAEKEYMDLVSAKLKHFEARDQGKQKRILFLRELWAGNYAKFSAGIFSFFKDFVGSYRIG